LWIFARVLDVGFFFTADEGRWAQMNADWILLSVWLLQKKVIFARVLDVGFFFRKFVPDVLVERSVLVELKAIKSLGERETAQCLNAIKATKLTICLLINFGNPKVEIKRIVHNF